MEFLEEMIGEENISLIIGGALVVLAVIALVWMYLWYEKTKEYNKILKSIDDKVDICNKEELKRELKKVSQVNETQTKEKTVEKQLEIQGDSVEGNDVSDEPKLSEIPETPRASEIRKDEGDKEGEKVADVKHSFMRAMTAIENLEKDQLEKEQLVKKQLGDEQLVRAEICQEMPKGEKEQEIQDKVRLAKEEAVKVQSEILKAARENEVVVNMEDVPDVEVKTVEIPTQEAVSVKWDESRAVVKEEPKIYEELKTEEESQDDEESTVDVFDEIRKMLVETEKNPTNEFSMKMEKPEFENVAKSGKEYTREELEDLIKF